jgi:glycerol-3-phosphate acyltransferase PlsX
MANPLRKLGAALASGAFDALKKRLDPEVYGGAVVLGLNGVVIKAHGSSRERAIANALRVAAQEIEHNLNQTLVGQIARANAALAPAVNPVAAMNS